MPERRLPEKPATDARPAPVTRKDASKSKGKKAPPAKRIRGKMVLKPKAARPSARSRAAQPRGPEGYKDQIAGRRASRAGKGYVRLRVHVGENGETSIVDSHFVAGDLVQPSALQGQFAYEVTEGQTRLHLDSIPDLGVFRSFVNPDGPLEERQHHMYELKSYDFDVRVPVDELAAASLSKVAIKLYRMKEARTAMPAGHQPLDVQYQRELREVTRVEGIPIKALPEAVQKLVKTRRR
jgi:hypothetical protein